MACSKIDLLDPDKLKANLNTRRIGRKILVYNCTSSTNDIAAEYAKSKNNDGLVIFAEQQTAGRGRAGAKWYSGRADSILCSIVLTNCKLNSELLSLACAVAIAEAIGKIAHSEAKIKWPNDIILNDKKVAGILLESKSHENNNIYIIGIGVNCHQKKDDFPAPLRSIATSIDIESQIVCDRISLAKRVLISLDHWLEVAEKSSEKVIRRWKELSTLLNRRVEVVFNGKNFIGNCVGIDPERGLILQLDTGGTAFFPAAHITIMKQ